MSATENRLLKQCKLKFQNCCELNGGAVNVEIFVGKFMQNIRLGKCSLRLLGQLSGQLLLLSVFAEGIGACVGIVYGETLGDVLPYYLLAFLSLYLYFSISGLVDVQGKQEALKMSVMDFLENRMKGRIVSVKRDSEYLDRVEKAGKTAAAAKKQQAYLPDADPAGQTAGDEARYNAAPGVPDGAASCRTADPAARDAFGRAASEVSDRTADPAARDVSGRAASEVSDRAAHPAAPDAERTDPMADPATGRAPADESAEKEELEALLGEFLA